MSVSLAAMQWVFDHSASRGTARLTLLAIADHAKEDGSGAFPSVAKLARKCGVDERTVQRNLRALVELGELRIVRRLNSSSVFTVLTDGHPRQSVTPGNLSPHPRQSVTGGGDNLSPQGRQSVTHNRKEPKQLTLREPAPVPARREDPIWDAVMAVCGIQSQSITRSSRGAYNRAVAELRALDATPTEIHRRATAYRHRWPNVSLTPSALTRHWAELDATPTPAMSRSRQNLDRAFARMEASR